jgi:hypothetical protein
MSWSYSGDPSTTSVDAVRFLIGDTDDTDPQLQNEEINWRINQEGTIKVAAYKCCLNLIAKYSRKADRSIGDLRMSFSQQAEAYRKLATDIMVDAAVMAQPYSGGISPTEKLNETLDPTTVQPTFKRGMMGADGPTSTAAGAGVYGD